MKYQNEESESHELESDELEEVTYAAARSPAGAAFFDIDGTLLAKPSLERRFFWELQRRGEIPARNYFAWLAETLRVGLRSPRDLRAILQTNKSYLRGVHAEIPSRVNPSRAHAGNATSPNATSSSTTSGSADHGGALPESWLPGFFPAAIQRVWWHALRGDAIALVTGTLAPLAEIVQFALERELLWRGVECKVFSIATKPEAADGCWTGRVAGAAIFECKIFRWRAAARMAILRWIAGCLPPRAMLLRSIPRGDCGVLRACVAGRFCTGHIARCVLQASKGLPVSKGPPASDEQPANSESPMSNRPPIGNTD